MSGIDVSEPAQRKLNELAGDHDVEDVLWKAMYLYERTENPSE